MDFSESNIIRDMAQQVILGEDVRQITCDIRRSEKQSNTCFIIPS